MKQAFYHDKTQIRIMDRYLEDAYYTIQIIMDKSKAFLNFMTIAYGYTKM